ncbi:MAG: hypothetical protein GY895_05095 [Phycisphaera sp.]|nr:hypothetical protein [Phycisphaera sp.]
MGLQGCGLLLSVGSTYLLTQLMEPSDFADFSVAITIASLLSMFSLMGLEQVGVRFIVELELEAKKDDLAAFEWWLQWAAFRNAFIAAVVAGIIGSLIDVDWMIRSGLAYQLAAIPFMNLAFACRGRQIGRARPIAGQMPEQIVRPVVIMMIVLAIYELLGGDVDPIGAGIAVLIASIIMAIWQLIACRSLRVRRDKNLDTGKWYRIGLPLMVGQGSFQLMNRADLLLVAIFIGGDSVAAYAVAIRLGSIVRMPGLAVQQVYSRDLVLRGDESRGPLVSRSARRASLVGGLASLLVFIVMVLLLPSALEFVGEAYKPGFTPAVILGSAFVLSAFLGPVGHILGLNGGQKLLAIFVLVAAVLNFVAGVVLIPWLGLAGAALATLLGLTAWKTGLILAIHRRMGFLVPFTLLDEKPTSEDGAAAVRT